MDTYFTEINHILLASRGYEYDAVNDLYFAPTQNALPSSSILKIISVGKCELYSEKYSYQ
jgi:hypothetical protein